MKLFRRFLRNLNLRMAGYEVKPRTAYIAGRPRSVYECLLNQHPLDFICATKESAWQFCQRDMQSLDNLIIQDESVVTKNLAVPTSENSPSNKPTSDPPKQQQPYQPRIQPLETKTDATLLHHP